MNIDLCKVVDSAFLFASTIINERKLTVSELECRKKSVLFNSQFDQDFVANLILGAIQSYHYQLKDILEEKGVDIGELAFNGEIIQDE